MGSDFFHTHAHSEWSCLDGMGTVEDMVAKADLMGQPALALTDHGNMSGCIRLYQQCKKAGLAAFPGEEFYLVKDVTHPTERNNRFHLGLLALDFTGYQALVKLTTLSHKRDRYYRKPLIDLSDLAFLADEGYSDHIALTTGCYFGFVIQHLVNPEHANGGLNALRMLATWFPHTFVEVQHHGIVHDTGQDDDFLVEALIDMADICGLPVVAGQDSHYVDEPDKDAHDLMKDICYFGDGEDNRFPGDSFHLATTDWVRQHYTHKQWDRIEEGHGHLLDLNRLSMPALDNYRFRVPPVSKLPMRKIVKQCRTKLEAMQADQTYFDRLDKEVSVISEMGMGNYFLLVQEVTDWCRRNGVIVNARGSANGSLVCYLLGITNVDPLQWGTSFDRFLSVDRKKPPDIDLDVESSARDQVVEHIRSRFPDLVQIGTFSRIGQKTDEDKGSVFVQYVAAMRRKVKDFDGTVRPEHRKALNALCAINVRKAPGAHAAGFVLSGEDLAIGEYIPTQLIPSSGTTVTQCVMEDVEEAGYVKLDVLGLRTLATLSQCLTNIGRSPNDFDWIPYDNKLACQTLRSGKTAGIFQFDGYSTMKGGKQMGVRDTKDTILCLALYRPAMMNAGHTDEFVSRRKGGAIKGLHPVFNHILADTLQMPVFQEQVMEMCRTIGMSFEDWNDLMKAVKASNDKIGQYAEGIFKRVKPVFLMLCRQKGMNPTEAADAWNAVVGFTDYGFNKAHATSYGLMAYRSAYLKAHHPLEYMQALLSTWAGTPKEKFYITEARRIGIQIARPDVNRSGVTWLIERQGRKIPTLRKGLTTVKGVGQKAAECIVLNRPETGYESVEHLISLVPAKSVSGGKEYAKTGTLCGVLAILRDAGALETLGV